MTSRSSIIDESGLKFLDEISKVDFHEDPADCCNEVNGIYTLVTASEIEDPKDPQLCLFFLALKVSRERTNFCVTGIFN